MCGDSSHLLMGCSLFKNLLRNPPGLKRVLSQLMRGSSSYGGSTVNSSVTPGSDRSSTPTRNNGRPAFPVRQLDPDNDTDIGTDDENAPDFR